MTQDCPCKCSTKSLDRVDSPVNSTDFNHENSRQGYQVYKCRLCGSIWGCRWQWDGGTGDDNDWHNFGVIDPKDVVRHH